jgi:phosphotransferase system enzyme I (PtsI)
VLRGLPGSPGIAIGAAVILDSARTPVPKRRIARDAAPAELARFAAAVGKVEDDLRAIAARSADRLAEAVDPRSLLLMVGRPRARRRRPSQIEGEGRCAEWAVAAAIQSIAGRLAAVDDHYLRERSHDVEFVGERLLRALSGTAPTQPLQPRRARRSSSPTTSRPPTPPPWCASPWWASSPRWARAPATRPSWRAPWRSPPSRRLRRHARHQPGDLLIVDGLRGLVIVGRRRPSSTRRAPAPRVTSSSRTSSPSPAIARGPRAITSASPSANIELPAEAVLARDIGAAGHRPLSHRVPLHRSPRDAPRPRRSSSIYQRVVEATAPGPVTLRTFDVGGDKFASTFQLPPEMNPMLGLRAVRLALSRPDVFLEQLRAMVRASAFGEVRIMIPMVSSLGELRDVRGLLAEAIAEVRARGLPCADVDPARRDDRGPRRRDDGRRFAREAAFLSLGTNDLVQYALAVDRTSRSLAYLASPFDPAILRLIAQRRRAGEAHGVPGLVCGAMASDPLAATLLLGLGLRELSMEAAAIPEIKEAFGRVSTLAEAEAVAMPRRCELHTAEEIEH